MTAYADRLQIEHETGQPALPCSHCGRDWWEVQRPWRRRKTDIPVMFPAICGHCHVIETAHHNDGSWLGMMRYSGYPGSFVNFVGEHAAYLRETSP